MSINWYILHVLTGEELKTKEFIESEVERLGYQNEVTEVFVPSEEVVQMRNGKKVKKQRLFYPGYLFISCHLTKTVEHFLLSNSKVLNFVGPKNKPQELSKREVDRMLEKARASMGKEKVENIYKVGDFVKIVDGPFTDFSGTISEINEERQRLKVMVTIFGRSTPVDLDFLQVKYE